ncbi:MAG: hypothetical protein V8R27_07570 [Oscillospiraceae bacterium]
MNDDGEYTLKALDTAKTFAETDNTTFKMKNDKAGITVKTVDSTNTVVTANSASVFVVRSPTIPMITPLTPASRTLPYHHCWHCCQQGGR